MSSDDKAVTPDEVIIPGGRPAPTSVSINPQGFPPGLLAAMSRLVVSPPGEEPPLWEGGSPHLYDGEAPPLIMRAPESETTAGLLWPRAPRDVWDLRMILEEFGYAAQLADRLMIELVSLLTVDESAERAEGPVPSWVERLFTALPAVPAVKDAQKLIAWDFAATTQIMSEMVLHTLLPTIYKLLKQEQKERKQAQGGKASGGGARQQAQLVNEIQKNLEQALKEQAEQPQKGEGEGEAPGLMGKLQAFMSGLLGGDKPAGGSEASLPALEGSFEQVEGNIKAQIDQAMAQLRNNARHMHKALDQLGRLMDSMTNREIDPSTTVVDDLTGIEQGGDLTRTIPSSLQRLNNPLLRKVFIKDMVERRNLQYRLEGKAPRRKRGDLVICIDMSGSMAAADGFGVSALARAAAAAALAVTRAAEQRRAVTVISFDHTITGKSSMNQWGVGLEGVLGHLMSLTPQGGTSFDAPIRASLAIMRDAAKKKQRRSLPDILLITDGNAYVSPDTIDQVEHLRNTEGLKLFAFTINGGHTGALEAVCDQELDLDRVAAGEIVNATIYR